MPQISELKNSYFSYILTYLHKHILTNLFQSMINITLLEAYIIYMIIMGTYKYYTSH